jgi:hypothetical protein
MMEIKKFFEHDSVRGAISSAEMIEFKHSCSEEEWNYFVAAAKVENDKRK